MAGHPLGPADQGLEKFVGLLALGTKSAVSSSTHTVGDPSPPVFGSIPTHCNVIAASPVEPVAHSCATTVLRAGAAVKAATVDAIL